MNPYWGETLSRPMLMVIGGVAGMIAGSFIGALVRRWPRGEQVVRGRSHCDSCGQSLAARDMVPLLSYLFVRGRCRFCGAAIPPVHFAAEAAAALVGATAFAAAPPTEAFAGMVFGWMLVALALLDIEHFWLPDRLTFPLALAGLGTAAAGLSVDVADSVIGAAAGYAVLASIALAYRRLRGRAGMGGGDPKLFAAIGAWLGWTMLPPVLLLASLAGLASVAWRKLRREAVTRTDRLPLGALLALAAWPLWLLLRR